MKKLFSDGKTFDSFIDSMDSDTSISQLYDDVVNLKEQLATAKADGIREAISVYKKKQPMKSANYYVVDALEHMKNYAYKLTSNTIDKGVKR